MFKSLNKQYKIYLNFKNKADKSYYEKLKLILFKTNIVFIFLSLFIISVMFLNIKLNLLLQFLVIFSLIVTVFSFFIECLVQLKLNNEESLFLVQRTYFNITICISFTLFFNNFLVNHFMEAFFTFSPRIALLSFSFITNFLLSEIIALFLVFVISNNQSYGIKLKILYFIKFFLFSFVCSGFFLMLLFKDYNFFITNTSSDVIIQISNDIYNGYTQLFLLFFIYKILLPKINYKIKQFENQKANRE